MIKYILFLIIIIYNFSISREYYVNSMIGSDTISTYDASSPTKAFKTITKAINSVEEGDIILIEGLNQKDRLQYHESIIVPENKPFFTIKGINYPIITSIDKMNNVGIFVLNSDIRIEGIEFDNNIDNYIGKYKLNGGAGIIIKNGNRDAAIINCKFDNCNYGIIANENQSLRIDGNNFNKIKKISNKHLDGGIALLIYSDGHYIQDNQIGVNSGNTFTDVDSYGIFIGNDSKLVLADYSKIENNTFTNMQGVGIGISYIEGIFNVSKNIFDKCGTSIELKGESIDAIISDNVFKGSQGDYEILADENYPGDLLYSIWKGNNNTFPNTLKAISEGSESSIKSIDGKRFISPKENLINSLNKNKDKILN